MAFDFDDYRKRFEAALAEDTAELSCGLESFDPVRAALAGAFGHADLRFKSASVKLAERDDNLLLTGDALDLLGLPSLSVSVLLLAGARDGADVDCILAAGLPAGWNPKRAFPQLPGYGDGSDAGRRSLFAEIGVENARVLFSTCAPSAVSGAIAEPPFSEIIDGVSIDACETGVNLFGRAAADGPLAPLGALLKLRDPMPLHGFISDDARGRRLQLISRLPPGTAIAGLPLTLDELALFGNLSGLSFEPAEGITMDGSLRLGGGEVGIEFYALAGSSRAILRIKNDFPLPGLDALGELLGSADALPELPVSTDELGRLTLRDLEIQLSIDTGHVHHLALQIKAERGWTIVPSQFSVDGLVLAIRLTDPFDAAGRELSVSLGGSGHLGKAEFSIAAEAPSFQVRGALDADPPLPLSALLPDALPEPLRAQDLAVRRAVIIGNAGDRSFEAGLVLDGTFTARFQSVELGLSRLALQASAAPGRFSAGLQGELDLAGLGFAFEAAVPEGAGSWAFSCASRPSQRVPIVELLRRLSKALDLPPVPDCPDLNLRDIGLTISTEEQRLHLFGAAESDDGWIFDIGERAVEFYDARFDLDYGPTVAQGSRLKLFAKARVAGVEAELSATLGAEIGFEGDLPEIEMDALGKAYLPGWPEKFPRVALTGGRLRLHGAGNLAVSCGVEADIGVLARDLGIPMPEGFEGIKLDTASLTMERLGAGWSAWIESSQNLRFPPAGPSGVTLSALRLGAKKVAGAGAGIEFSFTLDGKAALNDGTFLQFSKLHCEWHSLEGRWAIRGTVTASLFGERLTLQPDLSSDTAGKRFSLSTTGGGVTIPVVDPDCVFDLRALTVYVQRAAGGDAGSATTDWGLEGDARFILAPLIEGIEARLELASEGAQRILRLETKNIPGLTVPLGLGAEAAISLQPLAVAYRSGQGWSGRAGATLQLAHIPAAIDKFLPADEVDAKLVFDTHSTFLQVDALDLVQPLPALRVKLGKDRVLDLGRPSIVAGGLKLVFANKRVSLKESIEIDGLDPLNRIFGYGKDGTPTHRVLKSRVAAELGLSSSGAIGLKLIGSPFNDIPLREDTSDNTWWSDWSFGEAGRYSLQVPEFSVQTATSSWQASGGFQRHTPVMLPLAPLRLLLQGCGLPDPACKAIPSFIPLEDVAGEAAKLVPALRKLVDKDAPKSLRDAFDTLADAVEKAEARLPSRLIEYLSAPLPERFQFAIDIMPAGGFQVALRTGQPGAADPVPLSFMLPMMLPLPEIVGFSIRGLSLGLAGGGSLATIEFDGRIDRFGMLDLAAALLTPAAVLSNERCRALTNRLILDEVLAVMPVPAMVPIPLFYRQLGIDFKHFLGLDVQSGFSFPKPELSLGIAFQFITRFIEFFTVESYLMSKQGPPKDFKLDFTVGENYLRLPPYLRGQEVGLTHALPHLDVFACIAGLLDGLKTGNPSYLIKAIPLRHEGHWIRIGHKDVHFGPLSLKAAWCITTEHEFNTEILANGDAMTVLKQTDIAEVLEHLPKKARQASLERGFVVYLMAEAGIDCVASGKTQFGIALTREGGFETAFRWSVTLADLLEMRIGGAIAADGHGVKVKGATQLLFAGRNLLRLRGDLEVMDTYFLVGVDVGITDYFQMRGDLKVERGQVTIHGKVTWNYGGGGMEGIDGRATFGAQGMAVGVTAQLFGTGCRVTARLGGPYATPVASIEFTDLGAFQQSLLGSLSSIGDEVEAEIDRASKQIEAQQRRSQELVISLDGIRKTVAATLRQQARGLPGVVAKAVRGRIDDYVANLPYVPRKAAEPFKGGIKKAVLGKVKKELKKETDYMNALASKLEKATPKESKAIMLAALNDALHRYNPYEYTYVAPKPLQKLRYTYKYYLPDSLIGTIKDAKQQLQALDESTRIYVQSSDLKSIEEKRRQLIRDIGEKTQQQVDEQVPQVQSVGFETGLGRIKKAQSSIRVKLRYKKQDYVYSVAGDLGDAYAMTKTALRELTKALA